MSTLVDDKIEDDPDDDEDKEEDQEEDHQRALFFFEKERLRVVCGGKIGKSGVLLRAEPPKIASSSSEEDL